MIGIAQKKRTPFYFSKKEEDCFGRVVLGMEATPLFAEASDVRARPADLPTEKQEPNATRESSTARLEALLSRPLPCRLYATTPGVARKSVASPSNISPAENDRSQENLPSWCRIFTTSGVRKQVASASPNAGST